VAVALGLALVIGEAIILRATSAEASGYGGLWAFGGDWQPYYNYCYNNGPYYYGYNSCGPYYYGW
jgi:hypothetical protein